MNYEVYFFPRSNDISLANQLNFRVGQSKLYCTVLAFKLVDFVELFGTFRGEITEEQMKKYVYDLDSGKTKLIQFIYSGIVFYLIKNENNEQK